MMGRPVFTTLSTGTRPERCVEVLSFQHIDQLMPVNRTHKGFHRYFGMGVASRVMMYIDGIYSY